MKNEYRRLSTLYDIRQFCDRVSYLTTNWTRQQIEEDFTKLDSLQYNFTPIGEVTNRILKNDQEVATQLRARIPRIRDVVEFRNALIHDYDEVDVDEVWEIVEDTFPHFYQTIIELLIEFDPPEPKRPKP